MFYALSFPPHLPPQTKNGNQTPNKAENTNQNKTHGICFVVAIVLPCCMKDLPYAIIVDIASGLALGKPDYSLSQQVQLLIASP